MNRIYQGRVASVQIPNPDEVARKSVPWVSLDPDPKRARELGDAALWEHHLLFQDAVNYYTVALASLGGSPDSKLTKLREMLARVWESADKKGQRRSGMGKSLQRTWGLEHLPSLAEARDRFLLPLKTHGVSEQEMELAGESLLRDLGGEGSIQQGGPEYWPYFCQSGFRRGVTFPRSAEQLAKEDAQAHMAEWIWNIDPNSEIPALHDKLTQALFCNVVRDKEPLNAEVTKKLFQEALASLHAHGRITAEEKMRWSESLDLKIPSVTPYAGGSINKEALKSRFYAFLVFKHLAPDASGLAVLRRVYPKPEPKLGKRAAAQSRAPADETRLRSLGDDPIKLVRDKAQIVFRAFTALPTWNSHATGDELHERSAYRDEIERGEMHYVAWKDFDVAAFKEALKVYNQFQQNVEKREATLDTLATKLLVMDGERAVDAYAADSNLERDIRSRLERLWAQTNGKPKLATSDSGEDIAIARFIADPRIDRLRQIINADLAEEYRLTDGRRTPYGLRRRTMKGWSEVKRKWQRRIGQDSEFTVEKRKLLIADLDDLRGGEKREQIGSHKLFEALLSDQAAWDVWREPDEDVLNQINRNGWANDPLDAFREYCETREALEDISERPLNFTPADARFSRRLFIFTDACSFGNDGGTYRHDLKALAVTVPVAWRDQTGRYTMEPRRLVYSAPRLLRDHIRAEDGSYAQDWIQPMMRAVFGDAAVTPNPQELTAAAVQLMPDIDGKGRLRILLNFPLALDDSRLRAKLGKESLWTRQFHSWKKGDQLPFLRWPSEFSAKETNHWWEQTESFRVLAADLGTRHAASVALVEAGREQSPTARFIGEAGGARWYARFRSGAILRLPGENARVLRPKARLDDDDEDKAFREELHGARGRKAYDHECEHTIATLSELKQLALLSDITEPLELRRRFSFPEQNDKLLVALRRAQNWIATCVSWHWKLSQPDDEAQRAAALAQITEQERVSAWKGLAATGSSDIGALREALRDEIIEQRAIIQKRLLEVTSRVLPLRGRRWEWVVHPDKSDCGLLRQTEPGAGGDDVLLCGQRGLSIDRIEQLSELRRRWQSLNQSLRREIGQKPLTASEMRNDPIPDPCPDILRKLENLRDQRVNQTAHLIIAQALGLKLRMPQTSPDLRLRIDLHGEYEVARAPVDMIVLEDLSRYLSDQGRPKSENTRLMKWCHRAITLKVKMLAEPFGIPVLETPAAYSSRFCSLTGVAGFRAAEVGLKDRHDFRWRVLLDEAKDMRAAQQEPSVIAVHAEKLFQQLEAMAKAGQRDSTLLAPQPGGPIFVTAKALAHPAPAANRRPGWGQDVLPTQADINAAANLAFRAIAHPASADLHHRLRTLRKSSLKKGADTFLTREPRRFGKDGVAVQFKPGHSLPKERNSNLFFDPHFVAGFGRARLACDPESEFAYASGPGLWKTVNDREFQWERCAAINRRRLQRADDVLI